MFDENGNGAMAMVNHLMNVKDSRWLQVEVCREFQRGQCSREFNECKFAHPPAHVEVQNGRVTACYDSIKVPTPSIPITIPITQGNPCNDSVSDLFHTRTSK